MNNIMLDLETAGNKSDSAIISIGAVFFDMKTGETGAEFYNAVNPMSSFHYGAVDPSTIQWWMKQSEEARAVWWDKESVTLKMALEGFTAWVNENKSASPYMWGNGAVFDNVILNNAYDTLRLRRPWVFAKDMDVRTLMQMCKSITGRDFKKEITLEGTAHNALDDAKYQVEYCSAAYNALHGGSNAENVGAVS